MERARERMALEGCFDLQMSLTSLVERIMQLSPSELTMPGCGPEGPRSLCAVAEQLDECRARCDALRHSLGWPAARDPRCQRYSAAGSPSDN